MLNDINELLTAPGLLPKTDVGRITRIRRNRKILHGDLSELGEDFKLQWPRRIVNFYSEFLFANPPNLKVANNARLETYLTEISDKFFREFLEANKSLIAFGQGAIVSHPLNPLVVESFDPEHVFEVADITGKVQEIILLRLRGEIPDNQKLDIYRYKIGSGSSWDIYRYIGGMIKEKIGSVPIPDRVGNQIVWLDLNEGSIFDVVKNSCAEMASTLGGIGQATRKNLAPHLAGPSELLKDSDDGERVELDRKGSFLPLQEGDQTPQYITWDSNHPMAKYHV